MRRLATQVVFAIAAAAAIGLGGCGSADDSGQSTSSDTVATATQSAGSGASGFGNLQVGAPQAGSHDLKSFVPLSAASFPDGVAAFGFDIAGGTQDPALAMMRPQGGINWSNVKISSEADYPNATASLGFTQVMVGSRRRSGPAGSPEIPFMAVASLPNGGNFQVQELAETVFGGKSAEVNDISLTGDPQAAETRFIMVGATVTSPGGEIGDPTGTRPVAFTSANGSAWQPAAELPLPDGVTGAEAWSVTYAPAGTAYPGVLVAGTGWATDSHASSRGVGILWHSPDGGKTWNTVAAGSFNEEGRNLSTTFVAADNDTIVVAGRGDVPGGPAGQNAAIDWAISNDGSVKTTIDTLEPNRNSWTAALIARPGGGFLSAIQTFDPGAAPTLAGQEPLGNPAARARSSANGVDWTDQTSAIQDMESAMVISGIAESGGRVAFFGLDLGSAAKAYVVEASTLK